jgi:hypothetical protein
MKTKKKRVKKHYSDTGMARAFFDETLSPGIVSVGNSCRATPDRFWAFDTTFAAKITLDDSPYFLVRDNTNEPAYVTTALHNAMRRDLDEQERKYQHFYRRAETDPILHTSHGIPILEVARVVPNSTPSDWRADWVESLQFYYESLIENRLARKSAIWISSQFWHHTNIANNTLKFIGLPQLTRDELRVEAIENALAVELFKQKADGYQPDYWRSNYNYHTPAFLKAA